MINDKEMRDLQRLIKMNNVQSKDELGNLLESLVGKKIPDFSNQTRSKQREAQDLVSEAQELSPKQGREKALRALELDPDCIDAYEYLGVIEGDERIAITHFAKGVEIGKKLFDAKYIKKNKGHFWGLIETRPYMRCLYYYSDCLYRLNQLEESIKIKEFLIELNPNDNQGIRDELMLHLVEMDSFEKYDFYAKMFSDSEDAFSLYNNALSEYKKEGDSKSSNLKLRKAIVYNKFIPALLISKKNIRMPEMYGCGDEAEAEYYAAKARHIWLKHKDTIFWLKRHMNRLPEGM